MSRGPDIAGVIKWAHPRKKGKFKYQPRIYWIRYIKNVEPFEEEEALYTSGMLRSWTSHPLSTYKPRLYRSADRARDVAVSEIKRRLKEDERRWTRVR